MGLCIVKNEADILQENLISALHWCDHIYVFDNGSNDGTWELVKELAKQHMQIVPYKQDDIIFSDGLWADIFNAFRSNAGPRDWWCRLDADEFYIDEPRIFLVKIPDQFPNCLVSHIFLLFYRQGRNFISTRPCQIFEKSGPAALRYYLNHWGELRFFRGDVPPSVEICSAGITG